MLNLVTVLMDMFEALLSIQQYTAKSSDMLDVCA